MEEEEAEDDGLGVKNDDSNENKEDDDDDNVVARCSCTLCSAETRIGWLSKERVSGDTATSLWARLRLLRR